MEVNFPKSRYHDCLNIEFQHYFGAKLKNAIVVWQLQAMTGNDKKVYQHGTNMVLLDSDKKKTIQIRSLEGSLTIEWE